MNSRVIAHGEEGIPAVKSRVSLRLSGRHHHRPVVVRIFCVFLYDYTDYGAVVTSLHMQGRQALP